MLVYLAGPINGCTDTEAIDWRQEVSSLLPDVRDPMSRDYRGIEDSSWTEIVDGDKRDIDECDAVLAYCPKPSVGTSMEVLYAWERGKFVAVVVPQWAWSRPVSPWLRYHSHVITETPAEAAHIILNRGK